MNKREVIHTLLKNERPPYVPWSFGFTHEARAKLRAYFGQDDLEPCLHNHLLGLGNGIGFFTDLGDNLLQDVFGVVWDRSVDKDIGVVRGQVLPEPTLAGYEFPDPHDPRFFDDIPGNLVRYGDRFRVFQIGFSLYERAWTLRGMETLLMDFYDHPQFVHELLNAIGDYNIAQVEKALEYDIDAVYFGDDWGQQHGLQMGPDLWRRFIGPRVERMYRRVREAGRFTSQHSCGDVREIFDDLIDAGLQIFNPFQPEVMDVFEMMRRYRGRLAFHGGMSIQQTLPFGSIEDVRETAGRLLQAGSEGGYVFSPSHAVPRDVPPENLLAMMEVLKSQAAYRAS